MKYNICTVAAAPLRKEAAHRSEMTSQLLFGETMEVLETDGEWLRIRSLYDDYEGWLTNHLVSEVGEGIATAPQPYIATGLINSITLPQELVNAPMGASLTGFDEETRLLWDEQHKYHGTYRNTSTPYNRNLLERTIQGWINAPYLWGGRTFMGVDCSGFVQVVFKVMGIPLRRDAYLQAEQGEPVASLDDASTGDLAFFHNDKGRITHVGLLLNNHTIMHAAGKVRIDRIDKEGIVRSDDGRRTHQLNMVRRIAREAFS